MKNLLIRAVLSLHGLFRRSGLVRRSKCYNNSKRCEDDFWNTNYKYYLTGGNTPECCVEKLTELTAWVNDILRANGLQPFVLWGTHLGALRNGKIIPWDTDVDLGILAHDEQAALDALMKSETSRYRVRAEDDPRMIRVFYSASNALHVDIEVWQPHDQIAAVWCWDEDGLHHELTEAELYPLAEIEFNGIALSAPRTCSYLERAYGDTIFTRGYKKHQVFGDPWVPL